MERPARRLTARAAPRPLNRVQRSVDAGARALSPAFQHDFGSIRVGGSAPQVQRQTDTAQDGGEGQNRAEDVEWVSSTSSGSSQGAVRNEATGTATSTSPEITLETGNTGASPLNNLVHQQVCVDDGTKDCFSFAAVGAQFPQFSSTWLGWSSTVVGAILKGQVYDPSPVPGATIVSRHSPTPAQAANWRSYMLRRRLGLNDGYSVARHNCRTFSQWEFRDAPSNW